MSHCVHDDSVAGANEEASDAQGLIEERIDNLEPWSHGLGGAGSDIQNFDTPRVEAGEVARERAAGRRIDGVDVRVWPTDSHGYGVTRSPYWSGRRSR